MRAGGECITVQLDGGLEACNGEDDDFDGEVDENNPGGGGTCGLAEGECGEGVLTCTDGSLVCVGEIESTDEACDGLDNDCDGIIDEGLLSTLYQDLDEDGVGSDVECTQCGECEGSGPWVLATGDCDDMCATCSPLELEVCDGVDNNCDGSIDEDLLMTFYADEDRDTYGSDVTCMGCAVGGCGGDAADWAMVAGDCDPMRGDVFPGAVEVCDGVDNDCDGNTDEGLITTYYRDRDGDDYGTDETCEACEASECPGGADEWVTVTGDCDESPLNGPSVNPGVAEVCDHVDNNCSGEVDEGVSRRVYTDADRDGFGAGPSRMGCPDNPDVEPMPVSRVNGDCADGDERAHPGVTEFFDLPIEGATAGGGHDFNCDGEEELEQPLCPSCAGDGCWDERPPCGEARPLNSTLELMGDCFVSTDFTFTVALCR